MIVALMACRGSRRNSRQMSRQLSDAYGRGINPQDSYGTSQPGHSRQASIEAGPRVTFSRQDSMDIPTMSQPGRVAYGKTLFHFSPLFCFCVSQELCPLAGSFVLVCFLLWQEKAYLVADSSDEDIAIMLELLFLAGMMTFQQNLLLP